MDPSAGPPGQSPEERRHPWFERRVDTVMITAALGAGLLGANQLGMLGPVLLDPRIGWPFALIIVAVGVAYGFLAVRRVRCPRCSSMCGPWDGGEGGTTKVRCSGCGVVWDLGVSFRLKVR